MKGRDGDRRNRFGSSLDIIRQSQRNGLERRRSLLSRPPPDRPAAIQAPSAKPAAPQMLPPLRLYHRSDLSSEVNYVSAAQAAVSTVVDAAMERKSGVVFSWPDRINRPLGVTISALLRAQSARPMLRSTVAYYPFSDRKTHSLKSIFVDEQDLATRYLELIRSMDSSEYRGPDYQNAYLLKGLREASATSGGATISHPNLRELIPTFPPIEHNHSIRYADRDVDFLGDIASRRTLIREASKYRREISSKEVAPIAILGLPSSVDGINRLFRADTRLGDRCNLIIADATDLAFGQAESWLKGLRRLAHLARGSGHGVPIVVITQDGFIAKTAAEIIGTADGGDDRARVERIGVRSVVKIVPNDFTAQSDVAETWNAASFTTHLKAEELAQFRDDALSLASDLRNAGYPGAADAVVKAVTFARTIACLPIPLTIFREHLDYMERAGAVSDYVAAQYRYLGVADSLRKAEREADSLGDVVYAFRERVEAMVDRYANGGEVAELVRELIGKAVGKANRTIVAFRDRVVLSAVSEWLADREDIDQAKLESKLILTTTEALASTLSATSRGAPIDSLFLVNPKVRHFERIVLSPSLPRKVGLIGDGGTLGAITTVLAPVTPLFDGAPAARLKAVSASLAQCAERLNSFDFEKTICPEFAPDLTLDFTIQDSSEGGPYDGPVVELRTEDGYLLRLLPSAECLVIQEDELNPLKGMPANKVSIGDRIFVFSRDLHDRLEFLLGPVKSEGTTLLSSYQQAVRDRVALIPGDRQKQAQEILSLMKAAAVQIDEAFDAGRNEVSNVIRWMSTGRTNGRPDAPRSVKTFALFMNALGVPETIAAQYWRNAVVNSRVMAIQAGLHAHNRAQEFVVNPHAFYARATEKKPELKQLWEEMVRSASVVVRRDFISGKQRKENDR
ncbi:hypothetical protein ACVWZM_004128 [Bradyrhizobium sp. USDA 4501]